MQETSPQEQKEEFVSFSVRMPKNLVDQIDARVMVIGGSRNSEVIRLASYAIDHSVHMDNTMMEELQQAVTNPAKIIADKAKL